MSQNLIKRTSEISSNFQQQAEEKGLSFRFDIDPEIPEMLKGDCERFIQIINNVLSNAVKFTLEGGIIFKLNALPQPNNNYRLSIYVADTGVGINPELKANVFDSFNQMRKNNKREFGGIGLGLSIVNHLVQLFNGNIRIDSEVNKGTEVFIDLPFIGVAKRQLPFSEIKSCLTDNGKIHVLVVEDNLMNQLVMKKILSSVSYITCTVAKNGKVALEALQAETFDIILMDLQMPIMDGYEATKIIKSGKLGTKIENLPIIAVTADATQETKKRVMDLGMYDYMTKPLDRELLLGKIHQQCIKLLKIA